MTRQNDVSQGLSYIVTVRERIARAIKQVLQDSATYVCAPNAPLLREAMEYVLRAPSKHVRSSLFLLTIELYGYASEEFLPIAVAIEMLHTSSLVHDDLPSLDNAMLRRTKPSCHCVYGEGHAVLVGDALLTDAFYVLASMVKPTIAPSIIACIAKAVGSNGMLAGQVLDLANTIHATHSVDDILTLYRLKTGAFIEAVCSVALLCVCSIMEIQRAPFSEVLLAFAKVYGVFFQLWDDVLDTIGTQDMTGKSTSVDIQNEKASFIVLQGVEQTYSMLYAFYEEAKSLLESMKDIRTVVLCNDTPNETIRCLSTHTKAYAAYSAIVQTMHENLTMFNSYLTR